MNRIRIRLLGVVLLGALGLFISVSAPTTARAATTPTPITTGLPRFEPGACVFPLAPDIDPKKVVCGKVIVAETHGKNDGRTLKLAVTVYKAVGPNPAAEPLFYSNGGPGFSSAFLTAVVQSSSPITNDTIVYSQRGTEGAEPALICPQQQNNKAMRVSPILVQALETASPTVTRFLACRDYFLKQGINLAAFTHKENAADINDIRAVFGYPKMNFQGISGTGELGLRLANDFPQFTRSITIVSPTAPDNKFWLENPPITYEYALNQLYKTCATNASCKAITPDLKATFDKAFADLNTNPLKVTFTDPQTKQAQTIPVDGNLFSNIIFQFMINTNLIPFVPDIIAKTAKRDPAPLADIFTPPADPGPPPTVLAEGVYYGNICAHDFSATSVQSVTARYKTLSPQAQAVAQSALDDIAICQQWPTANADPNANKPVSNAVPTLILQGDLDPLLIVPYAEQIARQQTKSFLVIVPGGGHVPLGPGAIGECNDRIISAFLAAPTVKPDTSCISALKLTFEAYPLPQPAPSPTTVPAPATTAPATSVAPATAVPTPTAMPMPGLPDTGRGAAASADSDGILLPNFALAVGIAGLMLLVVARVRRLHRN